jgi:hypothetical protein
VGPVGKIPKSLKQAILNILLPLKGRIEKGLSFLLGLLNTAFLVKIEAYEGFGGIQLFLGELEVAYP